MRRSLAGLVLIVAWCLLALATSGWWMHRVAFSPSTETDVTFDILSDDEIRGEVAALIAAVDAPTLGMSPIELKEFVELITRIRDGSALMSRFVRDAHAVVIGDQDGPVEITAAEQVTIVRNEQVALNAPIVLPVERSGIVAFTNSAIEWIALVAAALWVLLLLAGVVLRPEPGEFTLALAIGLGAFAVLNIVLAYLVPAFALPAADDTTWSGVLTQLATRMRSVTLVSSLVAAAAALGLLYLTSSSRQRRQRSTPLAATRYRDQRSWSR